MTGKAVIKFNTLLYAVLIAFSSSCMSFRSLPDVGRDTDDNKVQQKAYVINRDELKSEYKILRFSKKYLLLEDSTEADVIIELKDMAYSPSGCVSPQVTVALFTLGFYPVRYEERYFYEYVVISGNTVTTVSKKVQIEKVVSWFHLFSLKKSRKKAIAKSI